MTDKEKPEENLSPQERELLPPTADQRRAAIYRALPMLLFTLCAVGVIGALAIGRLFQVSTSANLLDATYTICAGGSLASASPYPSDQAIHPIVAFTEENGSLQAASNYTREAWRATEVEEIELVLCAKQPRPAFRYRCDNQSAFNQYGGEIAVTLRAARTGEIVSEGVITADPAADVDCIADDISAEGSSEIDVPAERIHAWLAPFVEGAD